MQLQPGCGLRDPAAAQPAQRANARRPSRSGPTSWPGGSRRVSHAFFRGEEGQGRKLGIRFGNNPATCPVRALRAWLEQAGIDSGPLFRSVSRHGTIGSRRLSGKSVSLIVKRSAELAGYDPKEFSGHSLRAGLATSAARAGKTERAIMATTGHRSEKMVRRYIRSGCLFEDCASEGLL